MSTPSPMSTRVVDWRSQDSLRPRSGSPIHESQVAGTSRHEERQEPPTESAQAAGHQIGSFGVQQRAAIIDREVRRGGGRRRLQDQLPLVLSGRSSA